MTSPSDLQVLPITTSSEEAREYFELGRHAAFHYQPVHARRYLDAAIAADPRFVLAYLHRGGMSNPQERRKYFDSARANRGHVTEDERKMVDAFFAFLWEGEVERAVVIFRDLANRYPDDPYLPTYLGLRYLQNLGQFDEAKEQFRRAIEREPTFAQAHNWLGYVALNQEDYAGAEQAFRRYVELAPDQPRPYDSLGKLFLRVGRYDEASQQFKQALNLDPGFVDSRENLARLDIEAANRRFEEAFRNQDVENLTALYTEAAQMLLPGSEAMQGSLAISRYWRYRLDSGTSSVAMETSEIFLGADDYVTTELGSYSITNADREVDAGRYVTIWGLTPKGWKIHRSVWASEQPSSHAEPKST